LAVIDYGCKQIHMPESDLLPYAQYGKNIFFHNLRQASDPNVVDKV